MAHLSDSRPADDAAEPVGEPSVSRAQLAILVDAACETIGFQTDRERRSLENRLNDVAAVYMREGEEELPHLTGKETRMILRNLHSSVANLIEQLIAVPEDASSALHPLAPPLLSDHYPGETLIGQTLECLSELALAIGTFDAEFTPPKGRRANLALQSALMMARSAIADATGEELRAHFDRPSGNPPVFVTQAGRAIRDLLMGLDPALNETTIANMVEKLRTKGPTRSLGEALMAPGLAVDLDLSLHPLRNQH